MSRRSRIGLMAGLASWLWIMATPVLAQEQTVPPEHYTLDERGVDLVSGQFIHETTDLVIGSPGQGGIVYGRIGWHNTLSGSLNVGGSTYTVSLGAESEIFTRTGSTFVPQSNRGATLVQTAPRIFTFTTSDGVVATYAYPHSDTSAYQINKTVLMSVSKPNSETLTFHWRTGSFCAVWEIDPVSGDIGPCTRTIDVARLNAVSNNRGYQVHFQYATDDMPLGSNSFHWSRRTGAVGVNRTIENCDPNGACMDLNRTWPAVTYGHDAAQRVTSVTDQSGRATQYTYGPHYNAGLTAIRLPGSTTNDVTIAYADGNVSQVTGATGTWNYTYNDAGTTRTTTSTGPLGQQTIVVSDLTIGRATSVRNALGQTTAYQYDGQRRLSRITRPEGDYTQLAYDARGNATQVTQVAKSGSGLANIVTGATYPATCTNVRTCNQPTATTDARGQVTDYTYDAAHGGVLTVTEPAPTAGAARPQTRISYGSRTAWYKNSAGTLVASPNPVVLPVSVSACANGSSCLNTPDEIRTTVTYGVSGVANNLLPTSMTSGDGTGAQIVTTAMTYTPDGDVATVDGPLPGAGDTTTYRYDNARQTVGVIGPDPDGAGPLLRRATRATYDPAGRPTVVEQGTVTGLTDANWSAFAGLQRVTTTYDGYGRPTHERLQSGSTTHALTQVGYDAAGRRDCVATRMNPAAFAAPPASACTLGTTGPSGPDRIMRTTYDAASRPVGTVSGHGTPSPITEAVTHTANGQVQTLTDGQGNVSTVVYDGFDRAARMRYPNASGGGSSTTDFEQYTHDPAGNVLTLRNRAGETFSAGYDNLGRQTSLSGPAIAAQAFAHDNLGRLIQATSAGRTVTMAYDIHGRQVSETGPLGTVSSRYDAAGRRTSLHWPDGFWVAYDHNLAHDLTGVRELGVGWFLSSYGHDNLGRRTGVTRANGTTSTYGYDGAGRLASLTHDLAGTAQDVTYGFGYNPAGQIVSRTASNGAYSHAPGVGTTTYANNGRNQVTGVNGLGVGYDARQNIVSSPTGTFAHDGLNRLTTASGASLAYDPLGRLHRVVGGTDTRFLHDGLATIAEYDAAGALIRRHIPGLAMDETVVSYNGAGYEGRRWLLTDERGSIVAAADNSGTVTGINTYDDYGQPGAGNSGLFQYTGQIWLQGRGVYHYKARAYDPALGRFLQADPIGYAAGMNLYGYVGGDPVNLTDPLGLQEEARVGDVTVTGVRGRRSTSLFGLSDLSVINFEVDNGMGGVYYPIEPASLDELVTDLGEIVVTAPRVQEAQVRPMPPSSGLQLFVRPYGPFFRPTPSVPFPRNPSTRPGRDFQRHGGEQGAWFNKKTGESLRWDQGHGSIRPHYDYQIRPGHRPPGSDPAGYRWYPNGSMEPKSHSNPSNPILYPPIRA